MVSLGRERVLRRARDPIVQVSQKAEMDGLTQVVTGKARVEYRWSTLDSDFRPTWSR